LVKFYAENIKQNWDEKKGRNYVKLEYLDTTVKNMYFYLLDHFCQYQSKTTNPDITTERDINIINFCKPSV
jgi:hypothetical protein